MRISDWVIDGFYHEFKPKDSVSKDSNLADSARISPICAFVSFVKFFQIMIPLVTQMRK